MSNLILGMDGGASVTSKHRRNKHRKSGTSRIKGRELPTSSGDSADGELSDDSSDSDSSSADDQTTSRSSKMHKPSPKWNRQSKLQPSPKKCRISKENQIKTARKLMSSSSSDDSESDSNEDSSSEGSESNDNSSLDLQGLGSRVAKQATTAISKSLKQAGKANRDSSSEDDSGNDLKLHKPTPNKFNGASKKPLENKVEKKIKIETPITKNDTNERSISKLFSNKSENSSKELTKQGETQWV